MKIVYCTGALYHLGGAEKVLINKANYFAASINYEVWIITADQKNKPLCFPLHEKITFVDAAISRFVPKIIIPILTKRLLQSTIVKHYQGLIDDIQPDFIIVNELGYDDVVIPMVRTSAQKIREFHSSHEAVRMMIDSKKDWKTRLRTRYVNEQSYSQFNKFDCVVLLTDSDRKKAHYQTKIAVIPNTLLQSHTDISSLQALKAISVGRLDKLKNHIDQIVVWAQIVIDYPNWTLHIYGDGPEKDNLQQAIVEKGLHNNIFLEGVCSDLRTIYNSASLFLFTSIAEGFGMVLIEAMAAGVPCISYDCPCGPSEIIDDGINGYLIPVGDTTMMVEKAKELIANDIKRKQIGDAAFEKSKQFLPQNIMPRWQLLFESLLQKENL